MAHATLLPPPPVAPPSPRSIASPRREGPTVRFDSLVLSKPRSLAKGRSGTLGVSLVVHSLLLALVLIVPLFTEEILPAPGEAIRAFFVMPAAAAPPPPPPPPPAAGVRPVTRTPAAPVPQEPAKFVAPIEVPTEVTPEEGLDLGVEGGVPGGVEGGVPGGVVGGIVGGLPQEVAPSPVKAVRVGGQIKAPRLMHKVAPTYPLLAQQARIGAIVILEATVATDGRVQTVTVLRGQPLFDEAAMDAVRQWRYQPLLLNGVPTPFVLSVTLNFRLLNAAGTVE
jgi:protein TonB